MHNLLSYALFALGIMIGSLLARLVRRWGATVLRWIRRGFRRADWVEYDRLLGESLEAWKRGDVDASIRLGLEAYKHV